MIRGIAVLVLCGVLESVAAQSTQMAWDYFVQDGALEGQSGGQGFCDTWTGGEYTVSGGMLSGTGEAYRMLSSPFGSSGEIWVSFIFGVSGNQDGFGGLSFFNGTEERLIIGDWFEQDVWGMDAKRIQRMNSTVPILGIKKCVAKITLGHGAASSVDLWVGSDAAQRIDVNRDPDLTIAGVTLAGVDRLRIGSDFRMEFGNLILGKTAEDVAAGELPELLGLITSRSRRNRPVIEVI